MPGPAARCLTRGRLLILGLYVLVALVTPLLHHDVACHLQFRSHCDACNSSPAASGVESGVAPAGHPGPLLPLVPAEDVAEASADRPASPGRAPPAQTRFF